VQIEPIARARGQAFVQQALPYVIDQAQLVRIAVGALPVQPTISVDGHARTGHVELRCVHFADAIRAYRNTHIGAAIHRQHQGRRTFQYGVFTQ